MSAAGAFARTSSMAGLVGLSMLFTNTAQAGTLYDQCLVFVVDSSTSAQPMGWNGQMHGIAAGLLDQEVMKKVTKMNTGVKAGLVVFSSAVEEMQGALLRDEASLKRYADYIHDLPPPFGGYNNLGGALDKAGEIFKRIAGEGSDCLYKTIDFSGDGADSYLGHQEMQLKVKALARDGVTIHGLSFYDLRFKKYRSRDSGAWIKPDQNRFDDIHQYYKDVIVTPAGLGVMRGQHFTIDNQGDINTQESIVLQLTELMRSKVRFEVASQEDLVRARFAHDLARKPYKVTHNLR